MILKLHEVINLYYELNGITKSSANGSEVITQGLLKQKMSLKTKVYLQRLNVVLQKEVKLYEDTLKELQEEYGTKEGEYITIPKDKVEEFNKENTELLEAEKKINVSEYWGSDLTLEGLSVIETTEHYPILFKLLDDKTKS
jgi:hypothetical protein